MFFRAMFSGFCSLEITRIIDKGETDTVNPRISAFLEKTLSTNGSATQTLGSAFYVVDKELMLLFMRRRCIKK